MKITKGVKIAPAVWVHRCPLCGTEYAHSPSEDMLPAYSICDCDRNGNKSEVYELYEENGCTMIRRNKKPRFVGRVVFNGDTDIEVTEVLDDAGAGELAKAMRKAGEFLIKKSKL